MGMFLKYVIIFIFALSICMCSIYAVHNEIHSASLHDSNLFRFNWPGKYKAPVDSSRFETLEMVTADNEKYHCLIPVEDGSSKTNEKAYDGPNALELLKPLFTMKTCTVRMDFFWTYELCHGQWIKQYHEEAEDGSKRVQEYSLGVMSPKDFQELNSELKETLKTSPDLEVPQLNVEGINLPYFEVQYLGGTSCDLTGKRRSSRVLYVCLNEGKHSIFSVKEIYTCEYEIVILTSYLCQHPSYRPKSSPQIDLNCFPSEEGGEKRPKRLKDLELESLKMRTYGIKFESDLGSVILREVKTGDGEFDNAMSLIISKLRMSSDPGLLSSSPRPTATPKKPSFDLTMLHDFLKGKYCLHGGSGWWKYEFCYGKYVQQYRETDKPGSKYTIMLGSFDLESHKKWLDDSDSLKYKPGEKEIYQLYSMGDYCDEIKDYRTVQAKIRCKENMGSSISVFLLEPNTCRYALVVESSMFCPIMSYVDEWNLFPRKLPEVFDNAEATENKSQKGSPTKDSNSKGEGRLGSGKITVKEKIISDVKLKIKGRLKPSTDIQTDSEEKREGSLHTPEGKMGEVESESLASKTTEDVDPYNLLDTLMVITDAIKSTVLINERSKERPEETQSELDKKKYQHEAKNKEAQPEGDQEQSKSEKNEENSFKENLVPEDSREDIVIKEGVIKAKDLEFDGRKIVEEKNSGDSKTEGNDHLKMAETKEETSTLEHISKQVVDALKGQTEQKDTHSIVNAKNDILAVRLKPKYSPTNKEDSNPQSNTEDDVQKEPSLNKEKKQKASSSSSIDSKLTKAKFKVKESSVPKEKKNSTSRAKKKSPIFVDFPFSWSEKMRRKQVLRNKIKKKKVVRSI